MNETDFIQRIVDSIFINLFAAAIAGGLSTGSPSGDAEVPRLAFDRAEAMMRESKARGYALDMAELDALHKAIGK